MHIVPAHPRCSQGPKFRVHDCRTDVVLQGEQLVSFGIATDDQDIVRMTADGPRITMKSTREQRALLKALQAGTELLIEDGRRKIQVTERISDTEVIAKVVVGGRMKARQGVNVPSLHIDCPALTQKDIEDAEFLLSLDPPVEYLAMSFVQSAADIQELIDLMDRLHIPTDRRPSICPKIEKPQALANLSEILDVSGSMMVARGDLGVEMGLEQVPMAQKLMIQMAKSKGISPIINATQVTTAMSTATCCAAVTRSHPLRCFLWLWFYHADILSKSVNLTATSQQPHSNLTATSQQPHSNLTNDLINDLINDLRIALSRADILLDLELPNPNVGS